MFNLKYKITPHRITVWPKARLVIITAVLAFFDSGLVALAVTFKEQLSINFAIVFGTIIFLGMGIPFLLSRQKGVFDAGSQTFYRSIFFIKFRIIPFSEIAAVEAITYSGVSAGEYFALVLKKDPYGAGVTLSKAFLITDKKYKIWLTQLLPAIQQMLPANTQPPVADESSEPAANITITDFQFYKYTANGYITNTSSALSGFLWTFFGLILLVIGLYQVIEPSKDFGIVAAYLCILFGSIMTVSIFNFIRINEKEIYKSEMLGLLKTKRSTEDFIRFSTVRRTGKFTYDGTDVVLQFDGAKDVTIRSFYRTKKIDQFMAETRKAMGLK